MTLNRQKAGDIGTAFSFVSEVKFYPAVPFDVLVQEHPTPGSQGHGSCARPTQSSFLPPILDLLLLCPAAPLSGMQGFPKWKKTPKFRVGRKGSVCKEKPLEPWLEGS